MKTCMRILRDAAVAAVVFAVVALVFNAIRPEGIELVAKVPYEIFVPCPEPLGEVEVIDVTSPLLAPELVGSRKTLVIDAGSERDFSGWHLDGAWNVPFDYIEPVDDKIVRRIAGSGARNVVVYGDGSEPDSGHELARELAGRGITNVHSVKGGGMAIKAAREAR